MVLQFLRVTLGNGSSSLENSHLVFCDDNKDIKMFKQQQWQSVIVSSSNKINEEYSSSSFSYDKTPVLVSKMADSKCNK